MEFSEGDIVTGKVTGILKFGAFVALPGGKSGFVHISEISNAYVTDIHDCLTQGQSVKVKVLAIDERNGRINLSVKKAQAPSTENGTTLAQGRQPAPDYSATPKRQPTGEESFEDKLKTFMKDSESRLSDIKRYPEKKAELRAS